MLKKGETIVVTDASGKRTRGKLADVSSSPPALVVLIPDTRIFAEGTVAEIRATDPLWNGALIGGGIGTGLAMWDYLIDPSEPGNAAVFAVAIGLGTAIGVGIDALVGCRVLYRSGQQTPSLRIAPIAQRDRQGVRVSVRF